MIAPQRVNLGNRTRSPKQWSTHRQVHADERYRPTSWRHGADHAACGKVLARRHRRDYPCHTRSLLNQTRRQMRVGTPAVRNSKLWHRVVSVLALAVLGAVPTEALVAGATTVSASKPTGIMSCAKAVVVKPSSFVISCGDGNNYLQKIKWSKWTLTSALGTATYTENNCTPYCAAGKFINY